MVLAFDDDYPSLKALLADVSAENARAAQILYERYDPRFRRFVRRYLWRKRCWQADGHGPGVMQAGWGKIFEKIEGIRDCNSFVPWGYRIFRREADTHLRRCITVQKKQRELPLEGVTRERESAGRIDTPAEMLESAEQTSIILANAEEIHPKLSKILELRELDGLNFHEIAVRVNETYDNARLIYSRHRIKLRKKLIAEGFFLSNSREV
jgi:RNA polymerase sigma factor (sigma-70 family)